MNLTHHPKIVLLGLMSHFPVAGVVWQTIHYLVGLRRLGYEVYYVEAHGCSPTKLMRSDTDDGVMRAADYVAAAMHRFDFDGCWAYDSRYLDRQVKGMSDSRLETLYREAAWIINLHGATLPTPAMTETGRLVYLETDPVEVQVDLLDADQSTIDYLSQHCAFFSFGENLNNPDCRLPGSDRFVFLPTCQPVVMEFWEEQSADAGRDAFTTIGNWQQPWRQRTVAGEVYHWSKHLEFLKFIDLPNRSHQPFELALSSCDQKAQAHLESHGWQVRPALEFSAGTELDAYRAYVAGSRGEFTVAKDQNVRLRTGWFSDRSATYLAAGRPVITQETGFSNCLPTGAGLFAFSTMEDILASLHAIQSDYAAQRRSAREIAHEHFAAEKVLGQLLAHLGESRTSTSRPFKISPRLLLSVEGRWPTRLPEETLAEVNAWPVPQTNPRPRPRRPKFSIVILTYNGLPYTKMCLSSILLNTSNPSYEIIVVDNGSTDGTLTYLQAVAARDARVRLLMNQTNQGFAAGNNQGLAMAQGEILLLLNNDTMVMRGWLAGLAGFLEDESVGMVGPVTNRTCNEAQIDAPYRTYGELQEFARARRRQYHQASGDLGMLAMFCVALRRETFAKVGPLDERFRVGMFEDDDFAMRVRQAGLRLVCSEGTFVHHFGQGTIGEFCETGEYDTIFESNRRRFEAKWGVAWKPPAKRITSEYQALRDRIRSVVDTSLPPDATVVVVSKGDEDLLRLGHCQAGHFPQAEDGSYSAIYPADSSAAIEQLEALRERGAQYFLLPEPGFWWLEHYQGFRAHLERAAGSAVVRDEACVIYPLRP